MQSGKAGRWGEPTHLPAHNSPVLHGAGARASPAVLLDEVGENSDSTSRVAQPSRPQDSFKAPRPTLPLGSLRRGRGERGGKLFAKQTPKYHHGPPARPLEERSARGPLVGRLGSPAKEGLRVQSQGDAGWDGELRKTLRDPNTCMPVDVAHRTEKAGAELNDWQEKEQGLLVLSSLC